MCLKSIYIIVQYTLLLEQTTGDALYKIFLRLSLHTIATL